MDTIEQQVRTELSAEAARRREAMQAVGVDSELWDRIAAKRYCATCGKGEKELERGNRIGKHKTAHLPVIGSFRQCDWCHTEQLEAALAEERGYAAMVRRAVR